MAVELLSQSTLVKGRFMVVAVANACEREMEHNFSLF